MRERRSGRRVSSIVPSQSFWGILPLASNAIGAGAKAVGSGGSKEQLSLVLVDEAILFLADVAAKSSNAC